MKYKKASKLFFDKYALKVSINTTLAGTFRDYSHRYLDNMVNHYESKFKSPTVKKVGHHSWTSHNVSRQDFETFKAVHKLLKKHKNDEFSLRIESSTINVYTNDDKLLQALIDDCKASIDTVFKPSSDKVRAYLVNNKFKIIANSKPEYKFKITVNPLRNDVESFTTWAEQLSSKIKLLQPPKYSEGYFYALDDKVVTLCKLFLGGKIRRVDELVHESEI